LIIKIFRFACQIITEPWLFKAKDFLVLLFAAGKIVYWPILKIWV